jgi:hypothetical protein
MINCDLIENAVKNGDTTTLMQLKKCVEFEEFEKWISLTPKYAISEFGKNELISCSKPQPITYEPNWPPMELASLSQDSADHLGILSIILYCPNCRTLTTLRTTYTWIAHDLHAEGRVRILVELAQCEKCQKPALIKCSDFDDGGHDYGFSFEGYYWFEFEDNDPIFILTQKIKGKLICIDTIAS